MIFPPQPRPYAETHYRFRAVPVSRYYQRQPEIIADLPRRVEPGYDLPVLIVVKDAHRFPVNIQSVKIHWRNPGMPAIEIPIEKHIDSPYWSQLLAIASNSLPKAELEMDVIIRVSQQDKEYLVTNYNYIGVPKLPFRVNISEYPIPKLPGWALGDLHVHTRYTDDQVEFGAPVDVTATVAQAMGHDFFAATDHSYDLDDTWDSCLKNDPALAKYRAYMEEIEKWNREHAGSFQIIPGEEVSAGNSRGRNVHLLILGSGSFIAGMGDSAEAWFHNSPNHSIAEIMGQLEGNRVAIAAHPDYQFPLMERLLLKRDIWRQSDLQTRGLTGTQVIRGEESVPFQKGIAHWIKLLLKGNRLSVTTGTDAHGDFNRFAQVKTPMIRLEIAQHTVFGDLLTLIPSARLLSTSSLVSEIKNKRTAVTTGPGIEFGFRNSRGQDYELGDLCPDRAGTSIVSAISSPEFGSISHAMIWAGHNELQSEELLWIEKPADKTYQLEREIPSDLKRDWSYLRAEIQTQSFRGINRALTTPIFLTE
jgi:hypothetical protein